MPAGPVEGVVNGLIDCLFALCVTLEEGGAIPRLELAAAFDRVREQQRREFPDDAGRAVVPAMLAELLRVPALPAARLVVIEGGRADPAPAPKP